MDNIDQVYERGWIYSIRYGSQVLYVGSTIDYDDRKRHHHDSFSYEKDKHYNYKIYQIMRSISNNFDDFEFKIEDILVNIIKLDLKRPEDYYMNELKPIGNTEKVRPQIQIHSSVDKKAYARELYKIPENKEKIKQYQEDNKESKKEYLKQYKDKNKNILKLKN